MEAYNLQHCLVAQFIFTCFDLLALLCIVSFSMLYGVLIQVADEQKGMGQGERDLIENFKDKAGKGSQWNQRIENTPLAASHCGR